MPKGRASINLHLALTMTDKEKEEQEKIAAQFLSLKDPNELATLLKITPQSLVYWLHRAPEVKKYRIYNIPKKNGKDRTITAPQSGIKYAQTNLAEILGYVYDPSKKSAHGFIKDRSTVSNAEVHTNKRYVFNIDLLDFFPSINFGRVRGLFMAWPYNLPSNICTVIAQIAVHNNQLPQGAPTSPVISNMICAKMDKELSKLASKNHAYYTRYADDITFSTNRKKFPKSIGILDQEGKVIIGDQLHSIIQSNGFEINSNKIRLHRKDTRQQVTGLVVNKKVNLNRTYIRQVRAMLHAWEKYGLKEAQKEYNEKYSRQPDIDFNFDNVVRGKLAYIKMVRGSADPLLKKYVQKYNSLTKEKKVTLPLTNKEKLHKSSWIIESESEDSQGTGFYLKDVGIVTCEHVLKKDSYVFHTSDPSKRYKVVDAVFEKAIDLAVLKINEKPKNFLESANENLEEDQKILVTGFPNYNKGDMLLVDDGKIAGFRMQSGIKRAIIRKAPIISGMSGGAVLNMKGQVIGIAVRGAPGHDEAQETEKHEIIPISALKYLPKMKQPKKAKKPAKKAKKS